MFKSGITTTSPNMPGDKYKDLDTLVKRITQSNSSSELSKTLQEVESNRAYIAGVQLQKLKRMHDRSFRSKCVEPTQELYAKYTKRLEQDGDLQNAAAEIDRDLRIIEATLALVKERGASKQ